MAKTINKDIDIFSTLEQAQRAFAKQPAGSAILSASTGRMTDYFIDRKHNTEESALKAWPTKYKLIEEK